MAKSGIEFIAKTVGKPEKIGDCRLITKVSELDKYRKHLIYKEKGVLKGYNNG